MRKKWKKRKPKKMRWWNPHPPQPTDKFLFRLPAPFYRSTDHKIVAGPGAERVVFARTNDKGAIGVLGWIVERSAAVTGYVRYEQSPGFEGLKTFALDPDGEGITWCRGWNDDEALDALIVAGALS